MSSTPISLLQTILVVDDDPEQLDIVDLMLCDPSWRKLKSKSGTAALRIAEQYDGPIDLLLTDVVMADLDGCALAVRLLDKYPQMRVRYMSGYDVEVLAKYGVRAGAKLLIRKPFTPSGLCARIREALPPRRTGSPRAASQASPASEFPR